MESQHPTVFHITHWKAGSQWVRGVLQSLVPDRLVIAHGDMSNVCDEQLVRGGVYTPLYMATQWFDKQVTRTDDQRFFVVIRDLRDAAVSWYFSVKHSHRPTNLRSADDLMESYRRRFNELSIEAGLLLVIEERLADFATIQKTWLRQPDSARLIVRYEDLIGDESGQFDRIFDYAGLDPDPQRRKFAVDSQSFRRQTGRDRGQEKVDAHHRKGVAGDWQNHFTDPVKAAFKAQYGELLISTGYEQDLDW